MTKILSSIYPCSNLNVSRPTLGVIEDDSWLTEEGKWKHLLHSPVFDTRVKSVLENTCNRTCIALGCQLGYFLVQNLLWHEG